jgi:hypothetical protein
MSEDKRRRTQDFEIRFLRSMEGVINRYAKRSEDVGFEVFTAVVIKNITFWDMILLRSEDVIK